jgi:phage terminase small subunit
MIGKISEPEVDDQVSELERNNQMIESEETNHNMLFDADEFAKRGLSKKRQLTPKQEKFAQLFVHHDLTKKECALQAGYAHPGMMASNLLHHVQYKHVQDRIAELTEAKQLKYGINFEKVSRDLQMIRDAALEDGAYGPAVQAEMGRAKLAGLLIDKKEIKTGKIDQMDRSEVEARLRSLIEKHELVQTSAQMVEMEEVEEAEEVVEMGAEEDHDINEDIMEIDE